MNQVNENQNSSSVTLGSPRPAPVRPHFFMPPVGNPDSWFCDLCGWQVAMCGYLQRKALNESGSVRLEDYETDG